MFRYVENSAIDMKTVRTASQTGSENTLATFSGMYQRSALFLARSAEYMNRTYESNFSLVWIGMYGLVWSNLVWIGKLWSGLLFHSVLENRKLKLADSDIIVRIFSAVPYLRLCLDDMAEVEVLLPMVRDDPQLQR